MEVFFAGFRCSPCCPSAEFAISAAGLRVFLGPFAAENCLLFLMMEIAVFWWLRMLMFGGCLPWHLLLL
ncbi:hypothetical protein U1Q18_039787, partial [Sarracenia purpurea var. burkii]